MKIKLRILDSGPSLLYKLIRQNFCENIVGENSQITTLCNPTNVETVCFWGNKYMVTTIDEKIVYKFYNLLCETKYVWLLKMMQTVVRWR